MALASARQISRDWFWKKRNYDVYPDLVYELKLPVGDDYTRNWIPASQFPSEVHIELLHRNLIPDPFIGFNEHKVQWIGEAEWLYKTTVEVDLPMSRKFLELEFEGLDTICDVYLNGHLVLQCNNQFRKYTYDVCNGTGESRLSFENGNTLLIHFKSAKLQALDEARLRGFHRGGSVNLGDPSRLYIRKAQYDWRWDWGPELMTCGPYRPVTLRTYLTRIQDIYPKIYIEPTIALKVDVELNGRPAEDVKALLITLRTLTGNVVMRERSPLSIQAPGRFVQLDNIISWDHLRNKGVELWWPFNYGKQVLYNLEVAALGQENEVIDSMTRRIGFRSVKLIEEPLSAPDQYGSGTSFLFEINKVRMFMGGSNWIPADNFFTRITDERYRHLLELARSGNQSMIRIWGGGIYETDVFFDSCDELGILVWQDFQFACGIYPAHDEFVQNVTLEAEQNIKRLRHHPSLALLCGNNEDYQQILQWKERLELPARKIYEEVLPKAVATLTDPPIPYHRGSPYGGKEWWDTADPTVGDVHQWDIWGGKELPYQQYDKLGGRFISEFGLPSFPSMHTIGHWMGNAGKDQWYAQSPIIAQHIRAGSFDRRFAIVMNDNFRVTEDLETHAFRTQIMQAEGVGLAYRSWKHGWAGKGKEYTSGVLVWQLNDCWPVVSWAIIDYFMRPKPAYYTIARILKPLSLHVTRKVTKNRNHDRPEQFYEFGAFQTTGATLTICAVSTLLVQISATLSLNYFDIRPTAAAMAWRGEQYESSEGISTNKSMVLQNIKCPEPPADETTVNNTSATVVVCARLLHPETGEVLARHVNWPEPYKYVQFPDPGLKVTVKREVNGSAVLRVEVERPVKSLFFSVQEADERDWEVLWSDNNLDVVPGDPQEIVVKNLRQRKIQYAYLGGEKAKALTE
ncbi:hypothetical protein D9756_004513 [Leucocoprinus leucothites]|uniref:Beta-mannosidase B n=1 Tax=Leucocoprinus leucothites TaxID=201217 RepID=A0A8H5G8U8_9AGAR|nr:hypothetical protein D9756_004513 [Leucoagaricus leucothites]